MVTYTINLSPDVYYNGKKWSETMPDDQYRLFRLVHRKTFYRFYKYLTLEDNNEVTFEFCKNGNLHCHGYFKLQGKYATYQRHIIMINKYILSCIPVKGPSTPLGKYAVKTEYALDNKIWTQYMHKENCKAGYKPYIAEMCPLEKKTIIWFLENDNKNEA